MSFQFRYSVDILVIFLLGFIGIIYGAPWPPLSESSSDLNHFWQEGRRAGGSRNGNSAQSGFKDNLSAGIFSRAAQNSARIVTPACRCIDLRECPAIMEQIQFRPIDDALRKRLRATACGFRGFEPQVCCPSRADYDEGRMRRTPHNHNWSDWDGEDFEDFEHNHFGHFHFPSEPKSNSGSRDKPHRHRVKPVIWPENPQPSSSTSAPKISSPKPKPSMSPKDNNSREDRIINKPGNTNTSLVNPRICGVAINNRIIGGDDAGPGQFPWVARIGYRTPGGNRLLYRCGGAMINKDYVITAAHCVTNLPQTLQLAGIRLGEVEDRAESNGCSGIDCAEAPQDFRVGRVTIHPRYDTPRFANDIALIRLSRSANLTGYVSPICLPVGQFRLSDGNNLTGNSAIVAGWGSMTPDSATSSTSLQWVRLAIGDLAECRTIYRNRFNISVTDTHMCTRPRANVDACQGDSGGPLVMESPNERYLLAGIVSFGPRRCGTADLPGVYTRVSSFVDWLVENVRP